MPRNLRSGASSKPKTPESSRFKKPFLCLNYALRPGKERQGALQSETEIIENSCKWSVSDTPNSLDTIEVYGSRAYWNLKLLMAQRQGGIDAHRSTRWNVGCEQGNGD
jgi:hypothetical protein